MAARTPLILNQSTARVEELAAADTIPGAMIEGLTGRNALINGDFRFYQRGPSWPYATNQVRFFADRWIAGSTGSQVAGGVVATPSGGGAAGELLAYSRFFAQVDVVSVAGATNSAYFQQRIEDVRTFAGKRVTISFVARAPADNFKIGLEFSQNFGVGGGVSPVVNEIAAPLVLGSGWARYSVSIDIPSILGKTLGSGHFLQFTIWLDAGPNLAARSSNCGQKSGLVQFAEVQIEEGGTATGFERRPDALELMLCQRYYEKSYDLSTDPGTATSIGENAFFLYGLPNANYAGGMTSSFKVSKRGTPAVTVYSTQTGAPGKLYSPGTSSDVNATVVGIGQNSFFAQSASFGPTVTLNLWWHWTADAEL